MPNNTKIDYIAAHKHSAHDIDGLNNDLYPPTVIKTDDSGTVISGHIFHLLPEMTETIVAPSSWPLWEVEIMFCGSFTITNGTAAIDLRVYEEGGTELLTERFTVFDEDASRLTRAIFFVGSMAGGDSKVFGIALDPNDGDLTTDMLRLEITLRPYTG